MNEILVSCTFY